MRANLGAARLIHLADSPVQRRRDQNRISQRAFRLRKEKHARELESKVEELETLLETSSYENTITASRMYIIEAELSYYRGLLFVSSPNASKGSYITSYPGSDYRPSSNQFSAHGSDRGSHDTAPYVHAPAMASTVPLVLGDEYQRAGSYNSSSTGTYPLALDTPVDSFWSPNYLTASLPQRDPDGSAWSTYLVFNTEEPVLDDRIFKD